MKNLLTRSWLVLVGATCLIACASSPAPRTDLARPKLLLVTDAACCTGGAQLTLATLRAELRSAADLRTVRLPPVAEKRLDMAAVAEASRKAKALYAAARLAEAQRVAETALQLVQRSGARGCEPSDLARLHVLLGALALARRDDLAASNHFRAAVGFDPAIEADQTFSPPVRQQLNEMRGQRQTTTVTIRTQPGGAKVTWDGKALPGNTPMRVSGRTLGEHFLIIEHPLYTAWRASIRVSTQAVLDIQLHPRDAPQLLRAVDEQSALSAEVSRMLDVDGLLRVRTRDDQLEICARDRSGQVVRRARIDFAGKDVKRASARAERVVELLARALVAEPGSTTRPRPAAGFWRRTWWIWSIAVAVVVATAVAVPLATADRTRHDVVLEVPNRP